MRRPNRAPVVALLATILVAGVSGAWAAGTAPHAAGAPAPSPTPTLPTISPTPLPSPPQGPLLRRLASIRLPDSQDYSGSLAFDGYALYYAPSPGGAAKTSVVHRVRASDGARLSPITVPVRHLDEMSYNPRVHGLYVMDRQQNVHLVDLATLAVRHLFRGEWAHYSYDAVDDVFKVVRDFGSDLTIRDATSGKILRACTAGSIRASTVTASGTGEAYIQDEDDTTIWRVRDDCTVLGAGVHEHYAEADENDSMACDTVTFGVPAVWVRDGAAHAARAYEVPGGHCPLPTRLDPVVAPRTTVGTTISACTRLRLPHRDVPLADSPVRLEADGSLLGIARTDPTGRVCQPYTPRTPGTKHFRASYAGSLAYLPSLASGTTTVSRPVVVGPPPERGLAPPPDAPPGPGPQPLPGPVPAPVAQAPALQLQPLTQTQPLTQSQIQVQAAIVPQVQEELQVARAQTGRRRNLEMRRYRPRGPAGPSPLPLAAGAMIALAATGVWLSPAFRPAPSRSRHR